MCSRMQCSRAAATERKHMAPAMSAVQRPWWVRKNRAFWTKTFIISALYRGFATGVLAGELPSLGIASNLRLCACFRKKFVERQLRRRRRRQNSFALLERGFPALLAG